MARGVALKDITAIAKKHGWTEKMTVVIIMRVKEALGVKTTKVVIELLREANLRGK